MSYGEEMREIDHTINRDAENEKGVFVHIKMPAWYHSDSSALRSFLLYFVSVCTMAYNLYNKIAIVHPSVGEP